MAADGWAHDVIGWAIALGFIVLVLLICLVAFGVAGGQLQSVNPFAPAIRWVDAWQQHRHKMRELRLRLEMRRLDPDYTAYLEKEAHDDDVRP
jgi:hypothetical protein